MKIEAIITGDIVDSTKLSFEERTHMLNIIQSIPNVVSYIENLRIEIFRGDGFQIGIRDTKSSLRIALIVRAFLRSHKMTTANQILDARLALGIGTLDYELDSLSKSDGEAFRLSGRLLDSMDKARLKIKTPWEGVNEELNLLTAFADDIISSWTQKQSKLEMESLLFLHSHNEIAKSLHITRQMVDKSLRASKDELIKAYIERFEKLVTKQIYKAL